MYILIHFNVNAILYVNLFINNFAFIFFSKKDPKSKIPYFTGCYLVIDLFTCHELMEYGVWECRDAEKLFLVTQKHRFPKRIDFPVWKPTASFSYEHIFAYIRARVSWHHLISLTLSGTRTRW